MTKGRGRKMSLSKVECSKKVLLQIYSLKEKYQETWDSAITWLHKLFPIFPKNRWAHLTEKVVAEVQSCPKADCLALYHEVTNLGFIGERCESVGLTLSVLSDPTLGRKLLCAEVTNGLILELYKLDTPAKIY